MADFGAQRNVFATLQHKFLCETLSFISLPVHLNIHAGNFSCLRIMHAMYSATGISPEVTQGMQLSNKNNIVLEC